MRPRFPLLLFAALPLTAFQKTAPEIPAASEALPRAIAPEERVRLPESRPDPVDGAAGSTMPYEYEGAVSLGGTDFSSYRGSWMADGGCLSDPANCLVSTGGVIVQKNPSGDSC